MPEAEIKYRCATICYWSGTGNSYRVATWMSEITEKNGLETEILSFEKARSTKVLFAEEDNFVSLVFPTHGFTAPWHVMKFVWNLLRGNSTNVYCSATRAGPLYPWNQRQRHICYCADPAKGYKVHGVMSVDMPSNWYSLHPIQSRKNHEAIIDRAERKVAGFMRKALSHSKAWFTGNNLIEIILGALLSLVSISYVLFGKFFLAKLFFANSRCNGCGICENHCTVNAITMRGIDKRRPYWKYNCESCMKCAALCPHNAIEAGHSWGVILYFITALPVSTYLFTLLGVDPKDSETAGTYWLGDVLNILYFYPAIFVSYFVFSVSIRIPFINYLFTRTTMTHFQF